MTDVGASNDPGDNGTISLLRRIESGIVDPKSLAVPDRRQLVGFLMADGYSTAEMGQILQFADRTIERDKKAVRESNAIARDRRSLSASEDRNQPCDRGGHCPTDTG